VFSEWPFSSAPRLNDLFICCTEATLCLVSACYHQEAGGKEANGPARKDVWKEREAIIQNEVIIGFSLARRERFPYNPVDSLVLLARRHWHSARLQAQFEKVNLMNLILAQEAGK
jgi:hypothetical protein